MPKVQGMDMSELASTLGEIRSFMQESIRQREEMKLDIKEMKKDMKETVVQTTKTNGKVLRHDEEIKDLVKAGIENKKNTDQLKGIWIAIFTGGPIIGGVVAWLIQKIHI